MLCTVPQRTHPARRAIEQKIQIVGGLLIGSAVTQVRQHMISNLAKPSPLVGSSGT
jgi:hypothetical protein